MDQEKVQILADTSTLYSPAAAREKGILVSPLSVHIGEESYKEYVEITPAEFIAKIRSGGIPRSSQPAIGDILACYRECRGRKIINISMADGLSGTYLSAAGAREISEDPENIFVVNSGTLCGPHRYIADKAARLAASGLDVPEILEKLEPSLKHHKSYLIPLDFDFLKRGGRLAPWAASLGGLLKLVPVMTQTRDGRQLEKAALCRTFAGAVKAITAGFQQAEVGGDWLISITHADNPVKAGQAAQLLRETFPGTEIEILELSPVFIAQGGPGAVAVQAVLK
ncbi:MAG: DegV family protein [Peptococcaceae bacterium]|nr:DegV family protein [Peptococcaceae bacterium]